MLTTGFTNERFAQDMFAVADAVGAETVVLVGYSMSGRWAQWMACTQPERRLAYLLFHCGLKPREVVRFCPQEWSTVSEIYSLRSTIMGRFLIYLKSGSLKNSFTKN